MINIIGDNLWSGQFCMISLYEDIKMAYSTIVQYFF